MNGARKGGVELSRRTFFTGLALSLLDFPAYAQRIIVDAEKNPAYLYFLEQLDKARRGLKARGQQETLRTGSADAAFTILDDADHQITPDWNALYGTRHDPRPLENRVVALAKRPDAPLEVVRGNDVHQWAAMNQGKVSYGQGIPIAENLLLGNEHVLVGLTKETEHAFTRPHEFLDLALSILPGTNFTTVQTVPPPINLTDRDIQGEFVVLTGIDPDSTARGTGASVVGRKTYGGMAVKLTEPLIQKLLKNRELTAKERKVLLHSFIVKIPLEQGQASYFDSASQSTGAPFLGMSTAPVFAAGTRGYHFCGVVHSVMYTKVEGRPYAFAIFHGPDAINEFTRGQIQGRTP